MEVHGPSLRRLTSSHDTSLLSLFPSFILLGFFKSIYGGVIPSQRLSALYRVFKKYPKSLFSSFDFWNEFKKRCLWVPGVGQGSPEWLARFTSGLRWRHKGPWEGLGRCALTVDGNQLTGLVQSRINSTWSVGLCRYTAETCSSGKEKINIYTSCSHCSLKSLYHMMSLQFFSTEKNQFWLVSYHPHCQPDPVAGGRCLAVWSGPAWTRLSVRLGVEGEGYPPACVPQPDCRQLRGSAGVCSSATPRCSPEVWGEEAWGRALLAHLLLRLRGRGPPGPGPGSLEGWEGELGNAHPWQGRWHNTLDAGGDQKEKGWGWTEEKRGGTRDEEWEEEAKRSPGRGGEGVQRVKTKEKKIMGKLNQCDVTNTTGSYTCTTVCQKWKGKHNRWDGWLQNTDRTGTATENWLQHWLVCRLFPDQSINRLVLITVKMPIVMIWYLLWAKKRNSKFSHLRWCRRQWPTRTINRLSQLLSIKIHTNDSKSVLKIA